MSGSRPAPSASRHEVFPTRASRKAEKPIALAAAMPMPTMAIGRACATGAALFSSVGSALLATSCVAVVGSSRMRCALLPPNPKAEIPARSTPSATSPRAQGSAALRTRNGEPPSAASSLSTCRVGGRTSLRIASMTLMTPATPAAVMRCPVFDFNEPIARSEQSE